MISFAGGLPEEESFPELCSLRPPTAALQYGPTEGEPALRALIAERVSADGLRCSPSQVLVLSGSQQGIDLVAKLFVDPGTRVSLEAPTYLAALQAFRFFGAHFATFSADSVRAETLAGSAIAYANPTFQNPAGHCYSERERSQLARACADADVVLFEDDPYRELAYAPCPRVPVCAELVGRSFIYQGSFSKVLAPGLRLGFMVASPDLFPLLVRLKQAADLHSSGLSQWVALEKLKASTREAELHGVVERYRSKRDHFAELLGRHFGELADYALPQGGLFFWLRLKHAVDTRALLAESLTQGIAFMPGESFYADAALAVPSMRLNFSHPSQERASQGIARLGALLREAARSAAPWC
jgi:DNA-binding transcriptional MocR family regulator